MYSLIVIGIIAFLLSLMLTPLVRNIARCWGLVDNPDSSRKLHQAPVPRIGGIAIAVASLGAVGIFLALPLHAGEIIENGLPFVWRVVPAIIIILTTGLLDDIIDLTCWEKLFGEIAAGCWAFWAGVHLQYIGGHHANSWLAFLLTVGWLVLCTNAVNLIDGVDGLAAGIGLFATSTNLLAALLQHNVPLALVTAPLAGALLGFLRYNFNPATIFLGDCGSLLIGFLLGCCGIVWSQKSATILGMSAPLMALSIPLLDTGLAVVRRFLRQQPIFGADRGHIHHRLLDRGFTPRKAALLLYACGAVGALCSIAMSQQSLSGLVIIIFCAMTWIGIQHLGYVEFGVAGRMFLDGAFRRQLSTQIALHGFEQKLNAATTPQDCWEVIEQASALFGYQKIELRLAGQSYVHQTGVPTKQSLYIRVPISDSDYVTLAREFGRADPVAPLADLLRRVLVSKLSMFATADKPLTSVISMRGSYAVHVAGR